MSVENDPLVAIVPTAGAWESLAALCNENRRTDGVAVEPILCWGLTKSGELRPVTPTCPGGALGQIALRQVGAETVYVPGQMSYHNAAAWLAAVRFE